GFDSISFGVAGTIALNTGALPTITDAVTIDGTTAPGYSAPNPVVQIDFNNFTGLSLTSNASGSSVLSLSLVDANADALTLSGTSQATIAGNFVGLDSNGSTGNANRGMGVTLTNASNNVIQDNVISDNQKSGLYLSGSSSNTILGNKIGTDVNGTIDLGNAGNG